MSFSALSFAHWRVLEMIEGLCVQAARTGTVDENLIIADLIGLEEEELEAVRVSLSELIEAADALTHLLARAIEDAGEAPADEGADEEAGAARKTVWAFRQALSLIESSSSTSSLDPTARETMAAHRLRHMDGRARIEVLQAMDAVILAAAMLSSCAEDIASSARAAPLFGFRRHSQPPEAPE